MRWPPAASDFAEAVGVLVRENYERDGFLAPVAFVFATRNPETGRRIEPTLVTFVLVGHPAGFASQLQTFAREVDAPMLMQAYEVRMVGALREQPARGYEWLGQEPDAKDYVVMFLEVQRSATPLAWVAPAPPGFPLGAFETAPVDRVEGWLTAVLSLVS